MCIKIHPAVLDFPAFLAADGQMGCAGRPRMTFLRTALKTACLILCIFFRHLKCRDMCPFVWASKVKTRAMNWGMKGQWDFFWAVPNWTSKSLDEKCIFKILNHYIKHLRIFKNYISYWAIVNGENHPSRFFYVIQQKERELKHFSWDSMWKLHRNLPSECSIKNIAKDGEQTRYL